MKKMLDISILIAFIFSAMPVHVLALPVINTGLWQSGSLPPVRELGLQELALVRGGFSSPVGGGGKNGGSSQPVNVKRFVYPEVPSVYQRIQLNSRSDHYCGFAVALMLQYWVDHYKPERFWQEDDLEQLDRNAQYGRYVWPIDVSWNHGFLYSDSYDQAINWERSKEAARELFDIRDTWDYHILSTQPDQYDPSVGLTSAWNRIHGHDDYYDNERLPTIIVTKTTPTSLHYNLIVGTWKEGSTEKYWLNDPWLEDTRNPRSFIRGKLESDMSIPWGQYDWVGYVMDGDGVFGFLTEHDIWR